MPGAPEGEAPTDETLPYTPGVEDGGEASSIRHYGRFEVLGSLGSGGMGVVLLARDPDLDRKVALKILRPDRSRGSTDGAARLAREAQAMAKLAHPNVVTVHEVGRVGAQVFVAMELVEGTTLRSWLAEKRRSWREIVAMFVAAGRGLAAAHHAGMVHRDFKPDNVLIGRDGRPRVTDFGLVTDGRREDEIAAGAADAESTSANLTTRGTTVGTPAYMSAEQWAAEPTDARSDQFSFCVALWEAVHGARPFEGTTTEQIRASVIAGEIAPPPPEQRGPRALEAVLRRGLAGDPAARWPDLDALLAALERIARRRRWAVAGAAAGGAVVAAAAVITIVAARHPPDPCAPPTARIAAVWSPVRRAALSARLDRIDPAQGPARGTLATTVFDHSAATWREMYVGACRATKIEGRQTAVLLDRRFDCLDRALHELDETVGVLEQAADPIAIDKAMVAVATLPPLDACADVRALTDVLPPPTDPDRRVQVDAIDADLTTLEVAQRAGKVGEIADKIRAVVERARRVDHPPILARALWVLSSVDTVQRDDAELHAVLEELTHVAAVARDDRLAAQAWSRLLGVVAENLNRPDDAEKLVPAVAAAVARAGDPPDLVFDRLESEAQIWKVRHDSARALALMDQAVKTIEAAGAHDPGSPLANRLSAAAFQIGNIHGADRDWGQAAASYRTALELRKTLLGPDHPDVANASLILGEALRQIGKTDEAIAAIAEAARIGEARLAPSPWLATIIGRVGAIQAQVGHNAEAVAPLERALAMARATMPADDTRLADLNTDLGSALTGLGRYPDARARFAEALAIYDRRTPATPTANWAIALYNLADVDVQLGHCPDARPVLARCLAMFEQTVGATNSLVAYPLNNLARCDIHDGRWKDALARIARVQTLKSSDPSPGLIAHYLHGRVLVESGRDRKSGLAEVTAARADLDKPDSGASDDQRSEIDRWLAGVQ